MYAGYPERGKARAETLEEKSGRGDLNLTVFPILLAALPSTQKRFYEKKAHAQ